MSLLVILVVSAVELTLAPLAHMRDTRWVTAWRDWLGAELAGKSWWDGTLGLLLFAAVPMLVVGLLYGWTCAINGVFGFLFAALLALYCLGPRDLNHDIDNLLQAANDAEREQAGVALAEALDDATGPADEVVLRGIVVEAHDRIFAPLFWLAMLGPSGLVLFRLASVARRSGDDSAYGGLADAAQQLYLILCWVPERLFALGFGIAGSLTHAFDAWRASDDYTLEHGQTVMTRVAMAAMLTPVAEPMVGEATAPEPLITRLRALRGLLNRSYIVWLALLATLALVSVVN